MARRTRAGKPPKTNRSPPPRVTYVSPQRSAQSRVELIVAAAKAKKDLSNVFHRILTGSHVPGAHLDIAAALLVAMVGPSVVDDVMSHKNSSNVRLRDRQAGVGVIANNAGIEGVQGFASELVLGEEASLFFLPDTVLKLVPDAITLLSMPGLRVVRTGLVRRAETERAMNNEVVLQEASTKEAATTASPTNSVNTDLFPWKEAEEELQHPSNDGPCTRTCSALKGPSLLGF